MSLYGRIHVEVVPDGDAEAHPDIPRACSRRSIRGPIAANHRRKLKD
jgi:hypothetical protein